MKTTGPTRFFLVEEAQLSLLEGVAKRLYTERRMNGDEMRDAAHAIEIVVRVCREIEIDTEKL